MNAAAKAALTTIGAAVISVTAIAQNQISIGSGGTAGVYHPLGGAMARLLETYLPGTQSTNEATSASVDNIRRLVAGKVQIAFTQADTAWDAYKGYDVFREAGPQPIRTIAVLYPNSLQVIATVKSGIRKFADLRGKRVSTGAKGSGTEIFGYRLLEAGGIDPARDITERKLLVAPSVQALKDGDIDAFIWCGGIPTQAIADLAADTAMQIRIIDTATLLPRVLRKYGPVYTFDYIGPRAYARMARPVPVAQVWNLLVVRADMSEKLAYDIVKTLFEHKRELVAAHEAAKEMEFATQPRGGSPIPFHAGAKKYYRENGVDILR